MDLSARWPVVLFDLGGTLADTMELTLASYRHAVECVLGLDLDPEASRPWVGQSLKSFFSAHWPGSEEPLIAAFREFNESNNDRLVKSFRGMSELACDLRRAGASVGVVTSRGRVAAERTGKVLGLEVPIMVALEDVSARKPDPEPLLLAVERLGCTAERTVYVGDTADDVLAARAARMDSIGVLWGFGEREELEAINPTAVVGSVADLRLLLLCERMGHRIQGETPMGPGLVRVALDLFEAARWYVAKAPADEATAPISDDAWVLLGVEPTPD